MLLNIAKSKQPIMVFIIPIIMILLWVKAFNSNNFIQFGGDLQMPFYALLYKALQYKPILTTFFTLLLVMLIAFMINRLNIKFIFIPERSYLSSLAYIILTAGFVPVMQMNATLPAALLILIAIERLLDSYKNEGLGYNAFDASFLIGLASFFYFQSVVLLIFIWVGLILMRPFYWREWLYSVIGLALPWVIAYGILYITGNSPNILFLPFKKAITPLTNTNAYNLMHYIWLGTIGVIAIISSIHLVSVFPNKKILARKSFNLLFILFTILITIFVLIPSVGTEIIFIIAIPLSLLLAHFFIMAKHNRWVEILFWAFVLSTIFAQYYEANPKVFTKYF